MRHLSSNSIEPPPEDPACSSAALLLSCVLETEQRFYGDYSWCLNPCLTVREAVEQLVGELSRLDTVSESWQRQEVMTNAYLLAGTLLNSVDDYCHGPVYHVPRPASLLPLSGMALKIGQKLMDWKRAKRVRRAALWRQQLDAPLEEFLRLYVVSMTSDVSSSVGASSALAAAVRGALPADLLDEYTHIPSCFRKLDMTPCDVLALGRKFIAQFPDRRAAIVAVGLRTAGSYFAPLFRALLKAEGYQTVETVTIRPDKGLVAREKSAVTAYARGGSRAVIFDDPPVSGETLADAADVLGQLGFPADHITALFPVHPAQRKRTARAAALPCANLHTITLEPEQWHKAQLLAPAALESRLGEYFRPRGFVRIRVVPASAAAAEFNRQLEAVSEEERRTRLKRVFEVRLETADGHWETRYVLAKSVGWGYLSYHAFLAGHRLEGFVPPLLGLRDGLLFTEWLPQFSPCPSEGEGITRAACIDTLASYVAARARNLPIPTAASVSQGLHKHHHGFELLDKVLSKAYGHPILARLMRSRVRRRLAAHLSPLPTLIDGKMRPAEWIVGAGALLKTDFEHHGMGKNEVNAVDPAYDLAEAILQFSLSPEEEKRLIARYGEDSGDALAPERFFLYKLLAGLWTMQGALGNLKRRHLAQRQQEFHDEYVRAWDFLTVQTARHCGRLCQPRTAPAWRAPLVVLDVDGVIDRRLFGFPCTTEAGIQALAHLHANGFSIVLNTARAATEVEEYCDAYGCAGAVGEYGSYVWDAVRRRGRVLVSSSALAQLDRAQQALAQLPGVFLNAGYQYSLRACTYEEGVPVPLPTPLIDRFFADHNLDQLAVHQTSIDSTIVACEVNKGTGLTALLDWVGLPGAATWVVGDSEPDLAMFRIASRSFAPAHIGCARAARLAGCEMAPHPYQRGLLHIVRSLVHPDGRRRDDNAVHDTLASANEDLFIDLLRAADQSRSRLFLRAAFHPAAFELFKS